MPDHSSILLIDDSPGECELFRLALAQTGFDAALYTEHDAEASFHFLLDRHQRWSLPARSAPSPKQSPTRPSVARQASADQPPPHEDTPFPQGEEAASARTAGAGGPSALPSLILLDWRLRNQLGDTFLKRLRADARFATLPVVVFTTSDDASDLVTAYASGANGYVVKPDTFDELVRCVGDLCRYWIARNRVAQTDGTRC